MNDEEPSNKAPTPLRKVETYRDNEETKDDAGTFHISPWKDTNVELNFKEICIPDVIGNTSDVNQNIDSGESLITQSSCFQVHYGGGYNFKHQ